MTRNSFFSLSRFKQLAQAHITEKWRAYSWFFGVICMIYFIILLMFNDNGKPEYPTEAQAIFYYAGLITTGYVFAVRYFASMSRPESALIQLMQPTSTFEKWLLGTLMILCIYPILYTLLYIIMTLPVSQMSISAHQDSLGYQLFIPMVNFDTGAYSQFRAQEQIPIWLVYIGITGYAYVTSLMFKKLAMIKSFALGFGLFLVFLFLAINIISYGNALTFWFDADTLPDSTMAIIGNILFWVAVPLLLWAASFWALKERDLV